MKKLISLALSLCVCYGAFAQQEKIDELLHHFRQGDRICLDFSFCQKGHSISKTDGRVELQGNRYCLTMDGMKKICDGTTQWTVDNASREIYIEQDGLLLGYLSNPDFIKNSISSLSSSGNSLSGIFSTGKNGKIKIQFTLKNISFEKPVEDLSGFTFDTSDYTDSWVITDLR